MENKELNNIINEAKTYKERFEPRELTQSEVNELYALKDDDFNKEKLIDLFCVRMGQDEPRFLMNDFFTLPQNKLFNKTQIKTTVGKYIFNRFTVPDSYKFHVDYVNYAMSKKGIGTMEAEMPQLLLDNKMSYDDLTKTWIDGGEWLGMVLAPFALPSITSDFCTPIPEVIKRRDELFKQYEKELAVGDANVTAMVEKELLDMANGILRKEGNPGFSYYDSGVFSFTNNYKKNSIMGGAFINPATKKITITKSNYTDGVDPKEYADFAQLTIAGGHGRGVDTQVGGYAQKRVNSAMQAAVLDDAGSDCGTKLTFDFVLDKDASSMFLNRYIIDGGQLVLLDKSNISKYFGKEVKLRSPLYCNSPRYCSKCAGELFYKLEMKNVGLTISRFAGVLANLSMKAIHDSSVSFLKLDIEKYITEM